MTNKQIERQIEAFEAARQEWIDILVKNPSNSTAASHILSINSKIELLNTLRVFTA